MKLEYLRVGLNGDLYNFFNIKSLLVLVLSFFYKKRRYYLETGGETALRAARSGML